MYKTPCLGVQNCRFGVQNLNQLRITSYELRELFGLTASLRAVRRSNPEMCCGYSPDCLVLRLAMTVEAE
jgi:hypothetical protein